MNLEECDIQVVRDPNDPTTLYRKILPDGRWAEVILLIFGYRIVVRQPNAMFYDVGGW